MTFRSSLPVEKPTWKHTVSNLTSYEIGFYSGFVLGYKWRVKDGTTTFNQHDTKIAASHACSKLVQITRRLDREQFKLGFTDGVQSALAGEMLSFSE